VKHVRLSILGPDSLLLSDLCAECPQGPAGCCKAPPEADWSDIGRIVSRGGRDFLLAHLALGNLLPKDRGLALRRVRKREAPTEPKLNKCVFHGPGGCTIDHSKRPATCNYFLCEDAFVAGERADQENGLSKAREARKAHAHLRALYEAWDADLSARIASRYPDGPPFDGAFLDWLGAMFDSFMQDAEKPATGLSVLR